MQSTTTADVNSRMLWKLANGLLLLQLILLLLLLLLLLLVLLMFMNEVDNPSFARDRANVDDDDDDNFLNDTHLLRPLCLDCFISSVIKRPVLYYIRTTPVPHSLSQSIACKFLLPPLSLSVHRWRFLCIYLLLLLLLLLLQSSIASLVTHNKAAPLHLLAHLEHTHIHCQIASWF